jgi:undecaprenyl-diphosphatase
MTYLHAIILGIIEGLTEFLPISSTAHLDLTRQLLGLAENDFIKSFEVIIQLGAILAVLIIFWPQIIKNFKQYLRTITLGFLPTAIIGFTVYKAIKDFLGNNLIMGSTLLLGGLLILWLEKSYFPKHQPKKNNINNRQALQVGLWQALAMIPGVSRSGATILGGMGLGLKRDTIVEFSFLLAIPTMLAATGYDFLKNKDVILAGNFTLLAIGFFAAFASAFVVVKLFIKFVQKNDFSLFGYYRLIIGLLVLANYFAK